jgi:hypothetical protein
MRPPPLRIPRLIRASQPSPCPCRSVTSARETGGLRRDDRQSSLLLGQLHPPADGGRHQSPVSGSPARSPVHLRAHHRRPDLLLGKQHPGSARQRVDGRLQRRPGRGKGQSALDPPASGAGACVRQRHLGCDVLLGRQHVRPAGRRHHDRPARAGEGVGRPRAGSGQRGWRAQLRRDGFPPGLLLGLQQPRPAWRRHQHPASRPHRGEGRARLCRDRRECPVLRGHDRSRGVLLGLGFQRRARVRWNRSPSPAGSSSAV